jgi:hypothetical protein
VLDFKRRGRATSSSRVPGAASVCLKVALQWTANGSELQPSVRSWAPALDSGQGVRRCGWRTSSKFSSRGAHCITALLEKHSVSASSRCRPYKAGAADTDTSAACSVADL